MEKIIDYEILSVRSFGEDDYLSELCETLRERVLQAINESYQPVGGISLMWKESPVITFTWHKLL